MSRLLVEQIPVLSDNYIYLLHDPATGTTAAVDPAEAIPVLKRLSIKGWRLTHILNTHHHGDHIGGNLTLKRMTGCTIVGPRADAERIPGIDVQLGEGDHFRLGEAEAEIFDLPGHTRGHIAYFFADSQALFCGDTLFLLGCGRLFEGTPQQMWSSLLKLRDLPGDTQIYCAHEYTQGNARFAATIERTNATLAARIDDIDARRAQGLPTVPASLAAERATNPFLRADQPGIAAALGLSGSDAAEVFAELRRRKDVFR